MSFALAFSLATVICWMALALLLLRFRPARPVWPVVLWVILSGLLWSGGELGATFLAEDSESYWTALLVLYTGILFNGPLWWSFTIRFVELHDARPAWADARWERLALGLAVVCWIALVTNPWHGGFIDPVFGDRNHYRFFWHLQAGYGYLCNFAAIAVLVRAWTRAGASTLARGQIGIVLVASLLPLAANALNLTRLVDIGVDPTILAFGVGLTLVFFGIVRERLFALSGLTLDHWLEHESDGVAVTDLEGHLLRANRSVPDVLGGALPPLGSDFLAVLTERLAPLDSSSVERDRLLAELGDAGWPREGRRFGLVLAPERRLRLSSTPVPERWPRRGALILRLRDETELHAATRRAARQASSIEAILASIRDGLLVVDEAGDLLYANDRFWTLWNFEPHERAAAAESGLEGLLAGRVEDPEALRRIAARTRRGEASGDVELATTFGRDVAVSAALLLHGRDHGGRVWSFRDVTERRTVERERRRMEERLRESQKLESLGVLAGGIAHDFNNILVGILGNVDLAARGLDPGSRAYRHLGSVMRSADRAAELIQQLLAYAGRGRVELDRFDLSSLVEETLQLVKTAVSKKAALRLDLAPDLQIEGDPVQLRQIAMNLVVNASDALEGRAGTIALRTGSETVDPAKLEDALPQRPASGPGPRSYGFLEITDTGCGMDAATMGRIFEPFYSTKVSGRGLGLSAALGILRSHDGFIRVRSVPGEGTTFVLLLPLAPESAGRIAVRKPGGASRRAVAPGTVLVVDDEEAVRSVAQCSLELGGYRVLLAQDGHEAVALFRAHADAIQAVVLDMTMPRMDGAEALFAIRHISRTTPVVLSSGYSEQDTMTRCAGLSAVSFVQKPYTAQGLLAKVREAVASASESVPVTASRERADER